ncbi:MAG: uroporphyrinogen decarboxylase family protein [Candidatus Methylomirabilales bacterium]
MRRRKMTKTERIHATIERKAVDRPPVSYWRHFPDVDEDPFALADTLLAFHTRFDLDFIKVMPTGVYSVEDWGCQVAYRGSLDGSRACIDHAVKQPNDWKRIRLLNPEEGALGRELTCLRAVVKGCQDDAPIVQTVFSPLTIMKKLAGEERFLEDLRERPALIHGALDAVTETMCRYVAACLGSKADGIFFATQVASSGFLTAEQHRTFAEPYDRRVLEQAAKRSSFSILHVHGLNIPFDLMAQYPVPAINWHDRRTAPSLKEGRELFSGAVIGGLNEVETLRKGPEEAVLAEVADALKQTGGMGHILAPGCGFPIDVPQAHLKAVRAAVEEW